MRKWTSLGLAFGFTVACVVAAEKEPQYQGHSLSYWAKKIDPHLPTLVAVNGVPVPPPAEQTAIRSMGTNAIPILLKWIAQKDPPDPEGKRMCYDTTPGEWATMCFSILEDKAKPAIPALTSLALRFSDDERVDRCVRSLAFIGPDALPSFKIIFNRGRTMTRCFALCALPYFGSNAVVLLPEAVKCLAGSDEHLSGIAADQLSRLDVPDKVLVPMLTNALPTAPAASRGRIIRCLFWREAPAYDAAPSLRAALTDRNKQVRWEATNALQKIAPHILANTPAK